MNVIVDYLQLNLLFFEIPTEPSTLHTHSWNSGVVTQQPTCTAKGIITYTCTSCNATRKGVINEFGHNYTSTPVAPTCTEDGYTKYSCTRCGNVYVTDYIDATGHNIGYKAKRERQNFRLIFPF